MKKTLLLSSLLWFPTAALVAYGATAPAASAVPADPAVPITLGQSVVALTGPWKFHIGDDPRWADPNFDDSGWQPYLLKPGHSPLTPEEITQSAALPGWQQHGHPGYTGYAWYRVRLRLPEDVQSMALLMPQYVDDAYEAYVNGSKIGKFGELNGWHLTYAEEPKLFSIPAAMLDSRQPITLALRFWNQRNEASAEERNIAGGLRGTPIIGPPSMLRVFEQSEQEQSSQIQGPGQLVMPLAALYGAVGFISLFLFLFSRQQKEYLWAGISLTGFGTMLASIGWVLDSAISVQMSVVGQSISDAAAVFAMPLAAMYLLDVPRPIWRRATYAVSAINLAWTLQLAGYSLGLLPSTAALGRLRSITLGVSVLSFACLLLAIAVDGVRKIGRRAWLPMTPGLFFALYCILYTLFSVGILKGSYLLPDFICACVPIAVLIVFLIRFAEQQRENVRFADDMRQAQEVQQVILPEQRVVLHGFKIGSEYRPARQVSGDFYQIIPYPSDGSVLIVAGDVAGKGLQAGMLVAMLVGAIRTESEHTADPASILRALNARLCGREHAQATCLALRIESDGSATLANAGHLPPYLNGRPLEMEGALPLGMTVGAEFSVMRFHFSSSDRLAMISDGVVEARNKIGELFGFDRTAAISHQPAHFIASTAQEFGQDDDITVLTVARVPNPEPVPA